MGHQAGFVYALWVIAQDLVMLYWQKRPTNYHSAEPQKYLNPFKKKKNFPLQIKSWIPLIIIKSFYFRQFLSHNVENLVQIMCQIFLRKHRTNFFGGKISFDSLA
jgi:hypothetical protein